MQNRIFSFDSPKAIKASKYGWLNAIHYMAPYTLGGVGNLCPNSTDACRFACLGNESGQASFVKDQNDPSPQGNSVRQSRIDKAQRFMRARADYLLDVVRSIDNAKIRARKKRKRLAIRLNGSTDIAWEGIRFSIERNVRGKAIAIKLGGMAPNVFGHYPELQFVDYSKIAKRFDRPLPKNYSLTLSRSESNEAECIAALARGINVAVVFAGVKPKTWNGFRVICGDQHDLRHLDPKGVVVALSPKGMKAKRDVSGFVLRDYPMAIAA